MAADFLDGLQIGRVKSLGLFFRSSRAGWDALWLRPPRNIKAR